MHYKTPFWHFAGANLGFDVERHCTAFAARTIENAEREILVGADGLTTGSGIVEALVRAKVRELKCG